MPDAETIASELEAAAAALGTPERAEQERRYLKLPHWRFHGATVPTLRKLAKAWCRDHGDIEGDALWRLVDCLWAQRVWERRRLAVELLELNTDLLRVEDVPRLETMLRQSETWALVDTLAASVAGPLVERVPELGDTLDRWATDDDFWIRRASMLALLVALREGRGDWPRFTRYADGMLHETEFFIRKTIGWVLRDTSRKRPDLVAEWVAPRVHRMSALTFREAIKRLPAEDQERLRARRKAGS